MGAQIAIFLACVAGAKRGGEGEGGGGREKSAKEGKRKGSLPSFPNPSLFCPSRPLFSRRVKQEPKKVFAPRRLLDGEYKKRFAAIG